ncbi:acyloxyacyl hydrolase [Thiohalorhabdus methylotrophus]|uniref:Acyloxyacyl hydrolase n=1 Tax=Thiohalorhabdus methylotrophus TaxID=3242694 RepID=A0ABV4TW31_9GAMM
MRRIRTGSGWSGLRALAVLIVGGSLAAPAAAAERWIGLEVGTSDTSRVDPRAVDARRFNLSGRWSLPRARFGQWALVPYGELTVGAIRTWNAGEGQNLALNETGVRLLFQLHYLPWGRLFLEAGSGPMYLSDTRIGDLDLGSKLQFRSHAGLGVRLGSTKRWEVVYWYSHTSNANLSSPNPGINFHTVRLGFRY